MNSSAQIKSQISSKIQSHQSSMHFEPQCILSHQIFSLNSSQQQSCLFGKSPTSSTFGSTSRKNLFVSSVCSPAAKYTLKSGFDISLMKKKGTSMSSSRCSLGNSNFAYIQKSSNPGPAAYNPKKPNSQKKIVIGLKNRNECKQVFLNQKAMNSNPAPNKYEKKEKKKGEGKFVTLSVRFQKNKENKPGPGAYFKQKSSYGKRV